ncbi:MAG: phosphoribosylamine--glycine ligase, partial [Nitrospinaceae bacterium]
EVLLPAVRAMAAEGAMYRGVLYAGLMLTAAGLRVLEFNARMGDPETQPLMMRMQSDLAPLLTACVEGALAGHAVEWKPEAAACVVMAAGGYPGAYRKDRPVAGLEAAALDGVEVFHAGTRRTADGQVVTCGGRVLGVTALGPDVPRAAALAYRAVAKISWDNAHYRTDIGRMEPGAA